MSRIFPAPIIGESAASGAQVIDGSLKFDSSKKNYLTRTQVLQVIIKPSHLVLGQKVLVMEHFSVTVWLALATTDFIL